MSLEERIKRQSLIDMDETVETQRINTRCDNKTQENRVDDIPEIDLSKIIGKTEPQGIYVGVPKINGAPILKEFEAYNIEEDKTDLYGMAVNKEDVPAFLDCIKEVGITAKQVKRMVLMFNTEDDYNTASKAWEEFNRKEGTNGSQR